MEIDEILGYMKRINSDIDAPAVYEHWCLSLLTYYLGFGLFLGCIAYMIWGLVNDSNVCTAPVFWVFLGVSLRSICSG